MNNLSKEQMQLTFLMSNQLFHILRDEGQISEAYALLRELIEFQLVNKYCNSK